MQHHDIVVAVGELVGALAAGHHMAPCVERHPLGHRSQHEPQHGPLPHPEEDEEELAHAQKDDDQEEE